MADECVRALRNGDAAAFDAAYALYHRRIYDFLYRLSGRRDLAEDLFQETFIKLARHATTLREDTELGAWLFTVARNAYRSHRRWVLDLWIWCAAGRAGGNISRARPRRGPIGRRRSGAS